MEEIAFLRAMRGDLGDDLPWLAYADWLDEHDDAKAAEYLRVCVAAHQSEQAGIDARDLRRESQRMIANRGGARWQIGDPAPGIGELDYDPRGLIRRVVLDGPMGLDTLDALIQRHPIRAVSCRDRYAPDRFRWLSRDLDRLRDVLTHGIRVLTIQSGYSFPVSPETVEQLFVRGPVLDQLTSIGIDGACQLGESLVRLARSPQVPQLSELSLTRCAATIENLGPLLADSASRHIRAWTLDTCEEPQQLAERFLTAPYLERVQSLTLGRLLTDAMLPRLLNGSRLTTLNELSLSGFVQDTFISELAWSPRLERLTALRFGHHRTQPMDATAVIELITAPAARKLRTLTIPFPDVGDIILDILMRSDVLPQLESLTVSDITTGREQALLESPYRERLRELIVQGRRQGIFRRM